MGLVTKPQPVGKEAMSMIDIGTSRSAGREILANFGLAPFRSLLPPQDFVEIAEQTGCAPERKRALIPEVVAWLMMYVGLEKASMTQGLLQAWGLIQVSCPGLDSPCVTEEAFCQARKGLPICFWRGLWNRFQERCQTRFAPAMLWKGLFRVLAVDGSDVLLPNAPEVAHFFGKPCNQKGEGGRPQAKLVGLCSVFTGVCVGFKFITQRFSEHAALQHLIRQLRPWDLLLMDCGFFSYAAIWRIRLQGAEVLMRISDQRARDARPIQILGDQDWLVQFHPSPATRRKCTGLPKVFVGRLIRYQIPGYRPSWLFTSILHIDRSELVSLYHRRWQIETIYRELKHTLDIQNLRSCMPVGIVKEVHAQLILNNLIRWVMIEAAEGTTYHAVDLSFGTTLTYLKNALLRMLRADLKQIKPIYQKLLAEVRKAVIRKRPNRSYPRRDDQPRDRGNGKIRQPAKIQPTNEPAEHINLSKVA
jgi:hypothetical protein